MRPGFGQFNTASSEYLRFAAQYGVKDILLNNPILQEEKPGVWSKKELVKLKLSIESYNLQLSAIENVPTHFYDHIMLNGPKKNMQIENMIQNIENMADVGIPNFGYNWMPSHVWRTNPRHIRGGAIATAFDYESANNYPLTHDREYSEDEMWESLEEWIKIITPIAEKKNIRLGIHPCDPPVEKLGGIPQLLRSFDSYKRLIEIVDSPSNGIEFCQGTFSEMEDAKDGGIYEMIDYFSSRKKILYVHFRNVSGTVPKFNEEFINSGYVDMHKAMNIYLKNGFDSFFIDDHVPQTNHDTEWGHAGRAFANGYIQALIESTLKQKKSDE
jgi:mannonate dehydratase|tara:strand:+ start:2316 stop:3299 length:984 start_codon:yes stop_codon:yes gene_type:complete